MSSQLGSWQAASMLSWHADLARCALNTPCTLCAGVRMPACCRERCSTLLWQPAAVELQGAAAAAGTRQQASVAGSSSCPVGPGGAPLQTAIHSCRGPTAAMQWRRKLLLLLFSFTLSFPVAGARQGVPTSRSLPGMPRACCPPLQFALHFELQLQSF